MGAASGGPRVGEHARLLEHPADEPFAAGDRDPGKVVAPEAARRRRHELSALRVEHEQHRPVGVEQARHPVHRVTEDLRGPERRRRDREDLLEAVEGLRIGRGDGVGADRRAGARGFGAAEAVEPLAEGLEGLGDLENLLAQGGRRAVGAQRPLIHAH